MLRGRRAAQRPRAGTVGGVEKQNPDRSGKGRLVWDGKIPNVRCTKGDHPPALQPRRQSLAKDIIWWKQRLPDIPVLMAKLDVAEACGWLFHKPHDVCIFVA